MSDPRTDDRLIVALDVPDALQALQLTDRIGDAVSFYKIGLGMLTGGGLAQFDLDFLTVHGDPHVVRAAKEGASGKNTKILAVTILTSLDRGDLDDGMMRKGDIAEMVVERAARALEAGADGVIASPNEAAAIRALPQAEGRLIVTPGVRPSGAADDDQKRIATPGNAISAGADHIVVGRPVWRADSPRDAALAIQSELAAL